MYEVSVQTELSEQHTVHKNNKSDIIERERVFEVLTYRRTVQENTTEPYFPPKPAAQS